MKRIYEPVSATLTLMGEPDIIDAVYRPFTYIYKYRVDEGYLLYNFLTRELLLLSEDEMSVFTSKIDINNKIAQILIKKWFLVPVDHNDAVFARQVRDFLRSVVYGNTDAPMRQFTILPTTDCNARCFYCFEIGRTQTYMSEQTASDVADYIIRSSKGNKVRIRWFGGEPLCNTEAIDIICSKLKANGTEFTCNFTTNGYLFNDENVKKALENWNTTDVQVTLDGTEKVYNRVKNFIYTGVNAFAIVTDNIERLLKAGIKVKVRMNMDQHNEKDLYTLSDWLLERFGKYDSFFAYVHLLFEDTGKLQMERTDFERHEMIQKFFDFEDYLRDRQPNFPIRTVRGLVQYRQCMADDPTSTSIMPDGHLGKCEHFSDTDFWGSIYSDEIDQNVIKDFQRIRYLGEQCDKCPMHPMCIHLMRCTQTIPDRCDAVDRRLHFRNIDRIMKDTYRLYKENKLTIRSDSDETEIQYDC